MSTTSDARALTAGFADPVLDSQSVFRAVLQAMSFPGRRQTVAPDIPAQAPLDKATIAMCLTLMDQDTPVWLDGMADTEPVRDYLRFHCGCPLAGRPDAVRFAVIADPRQMPRLSEFDAGSDQYPDHSATLVLQVAALEDGTPVRLAGPGIGPSMTLAARGLPAWFWDDWAANGALFPTGVDVILTCGSRLIGLPRSIKVED